MKTLILIASTTARCRLIIFDQVAVTSIKTLSSFKVAIMSNGKKLVDGRVMIDFAEAQSGQDLRYRECLSFLGYLPTRLSQDSQPSLLDVDADVFLVP